MVSKIRHVFVDTSQFKALIDAKDDFHVKAREIWDDLSFEKVQVITTNFVIDETLTLMRVRCGLEKAIEFRNLVAESSLNIRVIKITANDEAEAWKWFVKDWRGLSFTDCVSFAVMKRLEIEEVATFDKHFDRAGFKVVE